MSTVAQPTPRPWSADGFDVEAGLTTICTTYQWAHGIDPYGVENSEIAQANAAHIVHCVNSFDALTEAYKKLLRHVRDISSVVSFVGREGSGDEICIDGEKAREDWCPMCRIGECVQDALKVSP